MIHWKTDLVKKVRRGEEEVMVMIQWESEED
jgi:heme-degrading monooxygenase HmoA